MSMPPRHVLQQEGEMPQHAFVLISGWAFRFKLLLDGRRQILSLYLPGDFINYQALRSTELSFSVQSLTEVSLCAFDAQPLAARFHENKVLWERLEAALHAETNRLASRITDLGRRTALERVARLLLEIADRLGRHENQLIEFPLRQHHIADMLGLTAVHVSRTIKGLRDRGIIKIGGGALTIQDYEALKEIGGPMICERAVARDMSNQVSADQR